jgi:hypothetical protein
MATTSACGAGPEHRVDAATDSADVRAPSRSARCDDGSATWTATLADDPAAATVSIEQVVASTEWRDSRPWLLVTTNVETRARVEEDLRADAAFPVEVPLDHAPRLVSPDRRCTIYLVPPGPPGQASLVVVGDSLAAGLVATADERAAFRAEASERDLWLVVDGQSGAPWTPLDDEGANLEDELRGARAFGDDVTVATVIGANDAIVVALTPEPERAAQRQRTDQVIATFVDAARREGRCVVMTTPPDLAIAVFGLGDRYAAEAVRVGDVLRDHGRRDPGVMIVDFAEVSRAHHLPAGAAGDWFDEGDELHPNRAGHVALRTMLLDAAERCHAFNEIAAVPTPASAPAEGAG